MFHSFSVIGTLALLAEHGQTVEFREGTHNLIRVVFGFGTAFLRLEGAPRHFFQTPNEGFVSQRPARATVPMRMSPFFQ